MQDTYTDTRTNIIFVQTRPLTCCSINFNNTTGHCCSSAWLQCELPSKNPKQFYSVTSLKKGAVSPSIHNRHYEYHENAEESLARCSCSNKNLFWQRHQSAKVFFSDAIHIKLAGKHVEAQKARFFFSLSLFTLAFHEKLCGNMFSPAYGSIF